MQSQFDKLMALTQSDLVMEGVDLPKIHLHKWLTLGQTEYVCRYGTLGDGHDRITDAQKYAGAIKELYYISSSLQNEECLALEAQAGLMDAQNALECAKTPQDKLRATAAVKRANTALTSALIRVEDLTRQAKVYYQVYTELRPVVESKYPLGIEQAESDNWEAIFKYRMIKEKVPGMTRERVDNIPLSAVAKAQLGYAHGRLDAIAPLAVGSPDQCQQLENKVNKELEHMQETK